MRRIEKISNKIIQFDLENGTTIQPINQYSIIMFENIYMKFYDISQWRPFALNNYKKYCSKTFFPVVSKHLLAKWLHMLVSIESSKKETFFPFSSTLEFLTQPNSFQDILSYDRKGKIKLSINIFYLPVPNHTVKKFFIVID